jgi:hypothetical protein
LAIGAQARVSTVIFIKVSFQRLASLDGDGLTFVGFFNSSRFCAVISHQCVSLAMPHLVFRLKNSNKFHVLLTVHGIEQFEPIADRLTVGLLDRREVGGWAFNGGIGWCAGHGFVLRVQYLTRNVWFDQTSQMLERFLPAEIAGFCGNHRRNAALRDVNFYADGDGLDRHARGHFTG